MSKLDLLVIEGDKGFEKVHGGVRVSAQAYNAIELFMHFFPKTELDGAGRLTIHVCSKPDDKPVYYFSAFFKISIYYVSEEILEEPKRLKPNEWDEFYLKLIENVLKDIACTAGKEETIPVIEKAAADVRATGYELLIPMKKLSKRSPNREYQATTYRYLTPQGELQFIEIAGKSTGKEKYVISNGYEKFPLGYYAHKCEWVGNRFVIKDRQDCVRAYVDVDLKTMHSTQNKRTSAEKVMTRMRPF